MGKTRRSRNFFRYFRFFSDFFEKKNGIGKVFTTESRYVKTPGGSRRFTVRPPEIETKIFRFEAATERGFPTKFRFDFFTGAFRVFRSFDLASGRSARRFLQGSFSAKSF